MNELDNNVVNTEENTSQPVFWQLTALLLILIIIFSSAIVHELNKIATEKEAADRLARQDIANHQAAMVIQSAPKQIEDIDVLAESAIVWDVANQTALYAKNEHAILPLASVTKLMTTLLAHELLDPDAIVRITPEDVRQMGDSGLLDGETFSLENLNDYVLMTSSNDGAHALAHNAAATMDLPETQAFVTAMNIRAEQLELDSLQFLNPTGLDISPTQAGAFGSAHDIAKLMEHLVLHQPNTLAATTDQFDSIYNEAGYYHNAQNTNSTVDEIPGLIGSKTGYTDLAGGNLVVAFEAGFNRPIVIVVLGSTRTGRFTDVLDLTAATRDMLTSE